MEQSKFSAEYCRELKPLCDTCAHRSDVSHGICLAYPKGIPMEILTGEWDHHKSCKGDHGIRFLAKESK